MRVQVLKLACPPRGNALRFQSASTLYIQAFVKNEQKLG